jgi:hypothetical protein
LEGLNSERNRKGSDASNFEMAAENTSSAADKPLAPQVTVINNDNNKSGTSDETGAASKAVEPEQPSIWQWRSFQQNQSGDKSVSSAAGVREATSGESRNISGSTKGLSFGAIAQNLSGKLVVVSSKFDEAVNGLERVSRVGSLHLATPRSLLPVVAMMLFVVLFLPILSIFAAGQREGGLLELDNVPLPFVPTVWSLLNNVLIGTGKVGVIAYFCYLGALLLTPWLDSRAADRFNWFSAKLVRNRIYGNDHPARKIVGASFYPDGILPEHRSEPLDPKVEEEQIKQIDGVAAEAWQRAREILLFADFAGETDLKASLQQSGIVDWKSLVHTTYFTNEAVRGEIVKRIRQLKEG